MSSEGAFVCSFYLPATKIKGVQCQGFADFGGV